MAPLTITPVPLLAVKTSLEMTLMRSAKPRVPQLMAYSASLLNALASPAATPLSGTSCSQIAAQGLARLHAQTALSPMRPLSLAWTSTGALPERSLTPTCSDA